jgi:hypothetical protein
MVSFSGNEHDGTSLVSDLKVHLRTGSCYRVVERRKWGNSVPTKNKNWAIMERKRTRSGKGADGKKNE